MHHWTKRISLLVGETVTEIKASKVGSKYISNSSGRIQVRISEIFCRLGTDRGPNIIRSQAVRTNSWIDVVELHNSAGNFQVCDIFLLISSKNYQLHIFSLATQDSRRKIGQIHRSGTRGSHAGASATRNANGLP